jgi:hypothetical protein
MQGEFASGAKGEAYVHHKRQGALVTRIFGLTSLLVTLTLTPSYTEAFEVHRRVLPVKSEDRWIFSPGLHPLRVAF